MFSFRSVATALTMTAVEHRVQGTITSKENSTTMSITIQSSDPSTTPIVISPLVANKHNKKSSKTAETFTYMFTYWAKAGDLHTMTPTSDVLLFYPPMARYTAIGENCPEDVVQIEARSGLFIEGDVEPPIENVDITICSKNEANVTINVITDETGKYR